MYTLQQLNSLQYTVPFYLVNCADIRSHFHGTKWLV